MIAYTTEENETLPELLTVNHALGRSGAWDMHMTYLVQYLAHDRNMLVSLSRHF